MNRPEFHFDEQLRDILADPEYTRKYVAYLHDQFVSIQDPKRQVGLLGEISVWLRSLGELDKAEETVLSALSIIKSEKLGLAWEIQQRIRLAHIFQWKRRFDDSNHHFEEIIKLCRQEPEAHSYLDFAWQHTFVENSLPGEVARPRPKPKKSFLNKIKLIKKAIKESLILSGKKIYNGDLGVYVGINLDGPEIDWREQGNLLKTDVLELVEGRSVALLEERMANAQTAMHMMMTHYQGHFSSYWGAMKGVRTTAEGQLNGRNVELFF